MPYGFNSDFSKATLPNVYGGNATVNVTAGQSTEIEVDLRAIMGTNVVYPWALIATPIFGTILDLPAYNSGISVETYVDITNGDTTMEVTGHIIVHNTSASNISGLLIMYTAIGP